MLCKFCETIIPDNSSFCPSCGQRIDEKKMCPSCKQLVDENFTYCNFCGTSLTEIPSHKNRINNPSKDKNKTIKNFISLFPSIFLILGVLLSLVFVFLIGTTRALVVESEVFSETSNIFDDFNRYYIKDIDFSNYTLWFQNLLKSNITVLAIFGIGSILLSFISVVSFSTVFIVQYIRTLLKKTNKNPNAWGIACILSFFTSVISYSFLSALKLESPTSFLSSIACTLGPTAKAGIILTAIFLFLFIAGIWTKKIILDGKNFWTKKTIISIVIKLSSLVFSILALCFISKIHIIVEYFVDNNLFSLSESPLWVNYDLSVSWAGKYPAVGAVDKIVTSSLSKLTISSLFTHIFISLLILIVAFQFFNRLTKTFEKRNLNLILSITAFILSIAILISLLVSNNAFTNLLSFSSDSDISNIKFFYGSLVCTIVFTFLQLIVSILESVNKKISTPKA